MESAAVVAKKKLVMISIYPLKGEKHSETGGVASYTHNLVDSLKQQYDVTVLCDRRGGIESYEENEIFVRRVFKKNLRFFIDIIQAIKQAKPDIVHIQQELHMYGGVLSALLLNLVIIFGAPKRTALTMHGVVSLKTIDKKFVRDNNSKLPPVIVRLAFRTIFGWLAKYSTTLIVHENEFKKRLVEEYDVSEDKIYVIPHGVEIHDKIDRDEAAQSLGIDASAKNVLYMGYLTGYKGLDLLIEGFSHYLKEYPSDNPFLIIGAGKHPKLKDDSEYLRNSYDRLKQKAADMIPSDKFRWDGFIREEDIGRYFSAADISVYPYTVAMSSSGPMAISIGYGVPFIASDVFEPYLENKSLIFRQNKNSFAEVLRANLHEESAEQYIAKLRTERHWQAVGEKHAHTYEEALNKGDA